MSDEQKPDGGSVGLHPIVGRGPFEQWIGSPPFEHMCDRATAEAAWPWQYKRYETQLAWEAWQAATARCLDILERYQVPVGNSAAGEMACEWTMDALRQIRDEILAPNVDLSGGEAVRLKS